VTFTLNIMGRVT